MIMNFAPKWKIWSSPPRGILEYLLPLEVLQVKPRRLLTFRGYELILTRNPILWKWVALFTFNLLRQVTTFPWSVGPGLWSLGAAHPVGLQLAGVYTRLCPSEYQSGCGIYSEGDIFKRLIAECFRTLRVVTAHVNEFIAWGNITGDWTSKMYSSYLFHMWW